jgi:hypothetical protein
MAITALQLDGQNIGFQMSGGSLTVDLFTIDIASGVITSNYLNADQIRALKPVIDELFRLVPLADRASSPGNILGFLSKIVAVSAADGSAITLGISSTGPTSGIYQATVGATPAYLIMHLPYAPEGNIAWATGIAGGGGSGPAVPISLPNGGLGQDVSAFNGIIGLNGTSSAQPLIKFSVTSGAEAANTIKATITLQNAFDSSAYTLGTPAKFWLENLAGTFTIGQGGGYKGSIQYNNLATNRRALIATDNNGVVELNFTDALAETISVGVGSGPGAGVPNNGFFVGFNFNLTFV